MKFTEAKQGRIFILRLEDGDILPNTIEDFAQKKGIRSGMVLFLGGTAKGSKLVVGPQDDQAAKPKKMITQLRGTSEGHGVGTIFTGEAGTPLLHLHGSFGREEKSLTGCTREGITTWLVGEVVIIEMVDTQAGRKLDPFSGFELLSVD